MNPKVRVAIIDEHPLFREGIAHTILNQLDMEVVGEGETAQNATDIINGLCPDIVILSLSVMERSIQTLDDIMTRSSSSRILALAPSANDEQARAILRHGAHGYILKKAGGSELITAIRALSRGESYISPSLAASILSCPSLPDGASQKQRATISGLSFREQQILAPLAAGMSNKEIAIKLNLSEKTVKHHITRIFQKLQVRNRVEAAIVASSRLHPHKAMVQQDCWELPDRLEVSVHRSQGHVSSTAETGASTMQMSGKNLIARQTPIHSLVRTERPKLMIKSR